MYIHAHKQATSSYEFFSVSIVSTMAVGGSSLLSTTGRLVLVDEFVVLVEY